MKKKFQEYHSFTEEEFKEIWKNCLFVCDTNTLLNMYRYSRETCDFFIGVLEKLKKKKQLWIPYQVGYEFYENRITVINEYEKSYDEILGIMEEAKTDIKKRYKDHPFLDLNKIEDDINKGLSGVESKIKRQKNAHPKWLKEDDILEKINELFKNNVGAEYDEKKLSEIKNEGEKRYEKNIPPGFKDKAKPDEKKYGDLILWYQMIDKAMEINKPIVFISGDVKEDWWLQINGERLMPLPQLKKEMLKKAGVNFHIYTADRFLELYKKNSKDAKANDSTIKEVKKIRESEEERMRRMSELVHREKYLRSIGGGEKRYSDSIKIANLLEELSFSIASLKVNNDRSGELDLFRFRFRELANRFRHGDADSMSYHRIYRYLKDLSLILHKISEIEGNAPEKILKIRTYIDRIEEIINGGQRLFRFEE